MVCPHGQEGRRASVDKGKGVNFMRTSFTDKKRGEVSQCGQGEGGQFYADLFYGRTLTANSF